MTNWGKLMVAWIFISTSTKEGRAYLFEKRRDETVPWRVVLWCRIQGHPHGVMWYNAGGLEPNMTCRNCGDDLG